MRIPFKQLAYYLMMLIFALVVIMPLITSYKHVMSVMLLYSDLKIPFYYVILFLLFSSNLIFFWKFNFFEKLQTAFPKKIFIPSFLLIIPIIIGLWYIHFFVSVQFQDIKFIQDLRDVGVIAQEFVAIPFLIGIFILYTLYFILLVRKKNYSAKVGIWYFIISVVLTILFSFYYGYLNTYDYSYIAGPVNDVLHGKFLLINARSQYGFFSILLVSIIFHLTKLSLANIVLFNATLVTLQFIGLGIVLPYIIKNKSLAILTLITAIFANYVIEIFPPGSFPQTNVWRFGEWIIILFLILVREKAGNSVVKAINILIPFLIGFFLFWEIDSGVYLLFAYLCFNVFTNLDTSIIKTIRKVIPHFLQVLSSIVLFFLAINLYYIVFLGTSPNWTYYFADASYYLSTGFSFVPLPNSLWPKIIFSVYLINFLFIFTKLKFYPGFRKDISNKLLIFVLAWGIFHLTYFLGRSHLNNLHHIIIPFIICLFYDFDCLIRFLRNQKSFFVQFFGVANIALFLVLPTYFFITQGVTNMTSGDFFVFSGGAKSPPSNFLSAVKSVSAKEQIDKGTITDLLGNSIEVLKSKYGPYIQKNGITLVSWQDTWYLIALNVKNNIDSNNLKYFIREDEVHALSQQIIRNKYKFVFIDLYRHPGFVSLNQTYLIYNDLRPYYKIKETLDHLDVLELIN